MGVQTSMPKFMELTKSTSFPSFSFCVTDWSLQLNKTLQLPYSFLNCWLHPWQYLPLQHYSSWEAIKPLHLSSERNNHSVWTILHEVHKYCTVIESLKQNFTSLSFHLDAASRVRKYPGSEAFYYPKHQMFHHKTAASTTIPTSTIIYNL